MTISGIDPLELYGEKNSKLNLVKDAYPDLTITSRGSSLKISGNKKLSQKAKAHLEQLVKIARSNTPLTNQKVSEVLQNNHSQEMQSFEEEVNGNNSKNVIVYGRSSRPIKARTRNQKKMVELSEGNDILFAIGPAGTGKTYTAVALAVRALKSKLVRKIILTRPAVEAGENLGFLPGDLKDKIDPYLRPLYDALDDMIPGEKLEKFMGRTCDRSGSISIYERKDFR